MARLRASSTPCMHATAAPDRRAARLGQSVAVAIPDSRRACHGPHVPRLCQQRLASTRGANQRLGGCNWRRMPMNPTTCAPDPWRRRADHGAVCGVSGTPKTFAHHGDDALRIPWLPSRHGRSCPLCDPANAGCTQVSADSITRLHTLPGLHLLFRS